MFTLRQKVRWFAVSSRLAVLLLQFVSNAAVQDHNAVGVFKRPISPSTVKGLFDHIIDVSFSGLERWDAQYFLHIAENGYVYENTLAFFPLFPITIRFLSSCLNIVTGGSLAKQSLLILASVSLNTLCFVKAADALFCLSLTVFNDQALAYKAALLFCINPASIFFTAPYSEALFVLLSFQGMRHSLDTQYSKLSAIPFGLAAAARSNGILNIGFTLHAGIKKFINEKWPHFNKKGLRNKLLTFLKSLPLVFHLIESCTITLAPFIAYQVYCYVLYCTPQKFDLPPHIINYGRENGLLIPESGENFTRALDHWCHFKLPMAYSFVQDHYWNVGFLRYYEWKQVPNFLLAGPIICLILINSIKYFQQNKSMVWTLGFQIVEEKHKQEKNIMSPKIFVFVVHVVFLTLFCISFVHIQVTTRMICSASPVPYWYAAHLLNFKTKRLKRGSRDCKFLVTSQIKKINARAVSYEVSTACPETIDNMVSRWKVLFMSEGLTCKGKLIVFYFLSYTFLGTVLFSNFLPWT